MAADGKTMLEVVRIEAQHTDELIELCTRDSVPFKTTGSHRVMAPSYGGEPVTVKAEDLKVGNFVLCSDLCATRVTQISTVWEAAEVLAITF
jgi:intein/homing endonuclease